MKPYRTLKFSMLCWLFYIIAQSSSAQELELYEVDSFIHPKDLRTTLLGDSIKPRTFLVSFVYFGMDHNYRFDNEFSEATAGFGRSVNNIYYNGLGQAWQTNLSLSGLGTQHSSDVPSFRMKLEQAIYFPGKPDTTYQTDFAHRFMLSWDMYRNTSERLFHEFSIIHNEGRKMSFFGVDYYAISGLMYTWKHTQERHYISWAARSWNIGFGISFENDSPKGLFSIDSGVLIWEYSLEISLPVLDSSIHIIYQPACTLDFKTSTHEVGLFFGVPAYAKLF